MWQLGLGAPTSTGAGVADDCTRERLTLVVDTLIRDLRVARDRIMVPLRRAPKRSSLGTPGSTG